MRVLDNLVDLLMGSLTFNSQSQLILEQSDYYESNNNQLSYLNNNLNTQTVCSPLVIWHGLGDSYNSQAMNRVFDIIKSVDPSIYIYSVHLDLDDSKDQEKSLISNMNEELINVCEDLKKDGIIKDFIDQNKTINFMGFSQGGLFIRSLLEDCDYIRSENIGNVITYGSPHNGIMDLPKCDDKDLICHQRNKFIKNHIWGDTMQNSVVFAQYFRDVLNYDTYLEKSSFLAKINNEKIVNEIYKSKLINMIGKLVLIMFEKDSVVVPKESAWFYDWKVLNSNHMHSHSNDNFEIIELEKSNQYLNDYLGLKELNDVNKLVFDSINDDHMNIEEGHLIAMSEKYLIS